MPLRTERNSTVDIRSLRIGALPHSIITFCTDKNTHAHSGGVSCRPGFTFHWTHIRAARRPAGIDVPRWVQCIRFKQSSNAAVCVYCPATVHLYTRVASLPCCRRCPPRIRRVQNHHFWANVDGSSTMADERTSLFAESRPGPAYAFPGRAPRNQHQRQLKRFQCCICTSFMWDAVPRSSVLVASMLIVFDVCVCTFVALLEPCWASHSSSPSSMRSAVTTAAAIRMINQHSGAVRPVRLRSGCRFSTNRISWI